MTNDPFLVVCVVLAVTMLIWDTIEVGRNDAANLVNAVFGSRVLPRSTALLLAGAAVVLGATLSSDVIDTARKGIFDPTHMALKAAVAAYVSVYIVDTVLLYSYSAFGMPVSTTACLVFELLGAALAINAATVQWGKVGVVISAIVCSIILTGTIAFLIQRAVRGAIGGRVTNLNTLLLHGGWVGGGLCAGLCYFLLMKGMKNVEWVKQFKAQLGSLDSQGNGDIAMAVFVVCVWGLFAIVIHVALIVFRKRAAKLLFPILTVLGMIAMSFAFGQNDLANCASPGLAVVHLAKAGGDVVEGTKVDISRWMLFCCGLLLFLGMRSRNAERVTKAEISTGSGGDHVALWAPKWCLALASLLLQLRGRAPALAPRAAVTDTGKTVHYDSLRASVILAVSASVIATASSFGLPVSTTYVAFAAVVATGMADRIFQRGDAELKLGRAIWVVSSWFISALIAAAATGVVALCIFHLGIIGIVVCLLANLLVRRGFRARADAQARRVEEEAQERLFPERYALETEE